MGVTSGHFAATRFGQVHYRQAGEGPVLLLLHSNGHSGRQFEPMMERLATRFRCIAWDQAGHGDSDPLAAHASIPDFAARAVAFLDALGLDRVICLGNSVGGAIAAELAGRHADRLSQVFICECPLRTEADWAAGWPQVERNHAVVIQSPETIRARVPGADQAVFDWWNVERSKAGGWAMMSTMWALRRHDMPAALSGVAVPAVLVYGRDSQLAAKAPAAAALVPGGVLEWVDHAGHLPMLDDPARVAEIVLRHAR
jgi:3-oxoadipate enol-lactonase